MARRQKKSRRRRAKTISLINLAESYAYASVLTGGVANNTPVGFIGFDGAGGTGLATTNGGASVSLSSLVADPGQAFDSMQNLFMQNYQAMAVQAIGIGITFKFAKKLLRKPIANVNRNMMKPLGIGVRL